MNIDEALTLVRKAKEEGIVEFPMFLCMDGIDVVAEFVVGAALASGLLSRCTSLQDVFKAAIRGIKQFKHRMTVESAVTILARQILPDAEVVVYKPWEPYFKSLAARFRFGEVN